MKCENMWHEKKIDNGLASCFSALVKLSSHVYYDRKEKQASFVKYGYYEPFIFRSI